MQDLTRLIHIANTKRPAQTVEPQSKQKDFARREVERRVKKVLKNGLTDFIPPLPHTHRHTVARGKFTDEKLTSKPSNPDIGSAFF